MMKKIILENNLYKVEMLPEIGGKICSFYHKTKNFELTAPNSIGFYEPSTQLTPFDTRDASGFDDCFPNIDAEVITLNNTTYTFTDHGEIWRSSFNILEQTPSFIRVSYASNELPYEYSKGISLKDDYVELSYEIKNTGSVPLPCLWVFHGLVRYEQNMKLIYPANTTAFENAMTDSILGEKGTIWPLENSTYNFESVPSMLSNDAKKYYVKGKITEGYCAYYYPSHDLTCEITFDKAKLPYLGFWVTSGDFRGDRNCAFEPATGYYDAVSHCNKTQSLQYINPKDSFSFTLKFKIS